MKNNLILLILIVGILIINSCTLTGQALEKNPTSNPEPKSKPESSYISLDEMVIDETPSDSKTIEIYKDDIQERCERKYLEVLKYYSDGDLKSARLVFDNIIENLEFLYQDQKVSDSLMLKDFIAEYNSSKLDDVNITIYQLYDVLYSDDKAEGEDLQTEVKMEKKAQSSSDDKSVSTDYAEIEKTVRKLLSAYKYSNVDETFIKDVYESYNDYLSDNINLKEIILRSAKYDKFIKSALKNENLDELFFYVPAVMTAYYNGKNNGGIWRLDNIKKFKGIRNDIGASTAEVIRNIKEASKKKNTITVISEIVKERSYAFDNNFSESEVFNSDLADFLALALILKEPSRHHLQEVTEDNSNSKENYNASYQTYIKNPEQYVAAVVKAKEPAAEIKKDKEKEKVKEKSESKKSVRMKYVVKKGDNWQKIAKLFKISQDDLTKQNTKAAKKKQLRSGTTLSIKTQGFISYKAKAGDSLGKICKKYDMTADDFMDINNLKEKDVFKGRTYHVYSE